MATYNSSTGPAGPSGPAGAAGAAGSGLLIQTVTGSAGSTIDFAANLGTYTCWKVIGNMLVPSTNAEVLQMQFGTGGTPTYAATNYSYSGQTSDSAGTQGSWASASDSKFVVYNGGALAGSGSGVSFDLTITRDASTWACVMGTGHTKFNGGVWVSWRFGGVWSLSAAITAMRFTFATHGVASGTVSLYGIVQ